MSKIPYSRELCTELARAAADPELLVRPRPDRYEEGDRLRYRIESVWPRVEAEAELEVERFLGGGFAGQVYRVRLRDLAPRDAAEFPGLAVGRRYAMKILLPPSPAARRFRDALYWIGYQGPFAAQVHRAAGRAGLLWQKVIRRAARLRFGRETAVKDAHALFFDATLGAHGEITEWIEGRTWRLEADARLRRRRDWRRVPLAATDSPEYVAKRRFMSELVALLHDVGAPEFARQYEWYTLKSQPNVLLRTDLGPPDPASGLCAIDFRAGLVLLPFLPMSPADVRLIVQGLLRRGALVQFDRPDFAALDRFVARHPAEFADLAPLLEALRREEAACRRAQPDLTRQWGRLLADRALEADVRRGLAEGYRVRGLADDAFAARLEAGPLRFALFHLLGAIPFAGRWLRQLWGHARVRRHAARMLRSGAYLSRVFAARNAALLARWHRAGRTGEARTRWLWRHPWVLLAERGTLGLLPAGLHRALGDPARVAARVRDAFRFLLAFTRDPAFREGWFLATIEDGRSEGMLTAEEAALIAARVRDPFIVKYLKCLGVHFATLPVSEICFVLGAAAAAAWMLLTGHRWGEALALAGGMFAFLQVMPVSPGSLIRGGFVVYLMVRERNLRDYLVAAPVAFVKGVGYLAFPLQMTTSYPHLARFLAARWATGAVHAVPVFGEKGAWLEHAVFDAFFNLPQAAGRWLAPRLRGLLTAWMLLGIGLGALAFRLGRLDWRGKLGIEVVLAVVCLFVLPRALLYPVLSRRRGPPA